MLLGNHGMVATGADLEQAMWRAVELERAGSHVLPRDRGRRAPGRCFSPDEITRTIERFAGYGMTALDRRKQ